MSYQVTKNRVLQYIGIILIIGVFAGAYWYFKVYAGVKTNALSPTGSLTSGLVGYWPFDRVSVIGTTSLDRSTSKYNGSLSGGPTVTSGQIGQALNFDGSDDFMSLGSSDYLNVNATADMTISGWFFRDTFTTDDVIVAKIYGIGPGETGYGVYISSGDQLIFKIGDGVQTYTVTTSMTFTTSVWTHFSIVWDQDSAANTKIYINGQSVSTSTSGTISDIDDASYSHTFRVGALSAGGEPFDGKIDEVRVYNRTLTANEVLTLYSFTGIGSEVNSSASQPQGTGRLDSGLAGYWKLDEGSGTSAADSSTNANTGTLTNGPTWTTGQIGSAVDFDGTNDYITMGDQSIHEGMAMMALSGWIKMDALPASNYFVITKSSAIGQYRLAISSTGMPTFVVATTNNAWYSSGTTASGTTALTTSAWTHLLGTYDGQYVRLYVNGVLVGAGSQAISGNIVSSTSEFRLSYDSYGNYFNGQIDEVRLYSRALSADEVADLYRLTSPTGVDTSLKGYWSFNGQDISGTTAYDRSGAGNTGTLTNGPTVTPGKVGQALSFDGSDDEVSIADVASLRPESGSWSVALWAKPSNIDQNSGLVSKRQPSGSYEQWGVVVCGDDNCSINGKKVSFLMRQDGSNYRYFLTSNNVADGNWHHIVAVANSGSGTLKLYIDGLDVQGVLSSAGSWPTINNTDAMRIGSSNTTGYFAGPIDEVRVYNTALTAAQIQSLYQQGQSDEVNTGASQAQGTGRLDSGLAGYWKMDDGSGTSATDSSTNANTGTLTNGPTWTTGQIGGAVSFDGVDDYVAIGTTLTSTSAITVAAWVNASSSVDGMAIFGNINGQLGSDRQCLMYDNAGTNNIYFGNVVINYQLTGSLGTGTWHHVVFSNSGTTNRLYLDGAKVAENSAGALTSANEGNLNIGSCNGGNFFAGTIDEARVYHRQLSSDEVSELYRLTSPTGTDTSLKGYWSFNGKDISGTTAYDRSGAGNNGTLTNGPTVTPGKVGQALSFDGTDDKVSFSAFTTGATFTLSLWVRPNAQIESYGALLIQGTGLQLGLSYRGSAAGSNAGKVSYWDSGGEKLSSTAIADGAWSHIAVVVSAGDLQFYTNSVPNGTASSITSLNLSVMGDDSLSETFKGSIDEVRIYNTALTASQIQALYNAGK